MKENKKMKTVVLTGIMGVGKSTVGDLLKVRGFSVISADQLAREVTAHHSPTYHKLVQLLGIKYLKKNGFLDRARIAHLVFHEVELLKKVEKIVHPAILDLIKKKEQAKSLAGELVCFFEIPLLFEKKLENLFDLSVLIAMSETKRHALLRKNRGLSSMDISARTKLFIPQEEKLKKVDYIIWNNFSLKNLEKKVDHFLYHFGFLPVEKNV